MSLNKRKSDSELISIKKEIADFRSELSTLNIAVSDLVEHVDTLDSDFRKHEEYEKTLFDELLVAVLQNTKRGEQIASSVEDVRASVSGYVELQEELSVLVRFTKKIAYTGLLVGKFTVIFGIAWASVKYSYEWFFINYGG